MGVEPAFEQKFESYREHLHREVSRLASYIRVYRRLHERMKDRLDEMNIAPAFFQVVMDALFSAMVLWVDKLFDEHAERGFFNFLTFVEDNRDVLAISELQSRRRYPDGHWMLKRDPITLESINEDRARIRNLEALPSFELRRDKFYAHFDKEYCFDRDRFASEAPLEWGDLNKAVELMGEILNAYSAAYDGKTFVLEPINATDVDYLLDALHGVRKRKDS